ncbi:MAG: B12-binding domain-containing radical SAM protein [Magnetococcales bacterium]|nr:B12-binding domain-containing radical SAM protein [Magnetococcales bacterium]
MNTDSHPLNIGYIFSVLDGMENVSVHFVDGERMGLNHSSRDSSAGREPNHVLWRDLAAEILKTCPDLIAFSCYSVSMTPVRYIGSILRQRGFQGKIWAGGIHVTSSYVETLEKIPEIDGVVIGEGEVTIRELCLALLAGGPLGEIPGIAYRHEGRILVTPRRSLIAALDSLPMPRRTFPDKRYRYLEHILLSSRGCPFDCDFCDSKNIWTRKVRYRSGSHVAREIRQIAELGFRHIGIRDDTFTLSQKHVDDVCRNIVDGRLAGLRYSVGSRIDTMRDGMIDALKRMNVDYCTFGVETGNQEVQARILKKLDIGTVVPTIEKTNRSGIRSVTFFMLGHPDETEEELNDTFDLIRDLTKHCPDNQISVNIVCPYPGTGYWNIAVGRHGDFIDFYNNSLSYNHQASALVNLTGMSSDVLVARSAEIVRFSTLRNRMNKLKSSLRHPELVFHKVSLFASRFADRFLGGVH